MVFQTLIAIYLLSGFALVCIFLASVNPGDSNLLLTAHVNTKSAKRFLNEVYLLTQEMLVEVKALDDELKHVSDADRAVIDDELTELTASMRKELAALRTKKHKVQEAV